jgi:hypothetical protein
MHGPDLRSVIRRDKELTSQNFISISFNDFNPRKMESRNMVYVIELTVKLLAKFKVEEYENFYLIYTNFQRWISLGVYCAARVSRRQMG